MSSFRERFNDFVTANDMFGYNVSFNFNKKGAIHNTFIGGSLSLFINLVVFMYFM